MGLLTIASIQIKNMVFTAHALAANDKSPLSRSHLPVVIAFDEEFQKDYSGAGQIEREVRCEYEWRGYRLHNISKVARIGGRIKQFS